MYDMIARFYDSINSSVDYSSWADFAEKMISEHSDIPCKLILDAACGTGSMTIELARRGYDMTGVDLSPDMLSKARQRAAEEGLSDILFLCQDLGELDLYGTVDACVCTLDSINHITDKDALLSFFSRLSRCFLAPGGIFLFDVNTPHKFANFYSDNDFILEEEGMYLGWQNFFDADNKIMHFYLTLFCECEDGSYIREDSEQEERAYSFEELCDMLDECGLDVISVYSGFDGKKAKDSDERWYFVCKNRKK